MTVLVTLITYKVVLLLIGFLAARRTKSSEDLYLGGRQLGPLVAAISASASSSSSRAASASCLTPHLPTCSPAGPPALVGRLHAEVRMLREKVMLQAGHAAVLQAENTKLKRMYADLALENRAMKDAIEKKL